MKVFVLTDIEGVAGVVSFEQYSYPDGKYYEACKKLLTEEVNAAVAGMASSGVDEILVLDGHGPGGITFEDLDPPAQLIHGRPLAPWAVLDEEIKRCDVGIIIGQHAMAGIVDGNLSHTQSSKAIDCYKLNGKPIGEIAQVALYLGALGVPMIFLSGDEAACREAEELIPGITTVSVKKGLARNCAMSLSAATARQRICEGIKLALKRQQKKPLPPLVWKGPFVLEKRYFHTDAADSAAERPGVERVDSQTVRLRSKDVKSIIYA